jgi:methyl-accepting chemotaxis protein
MKIRRFSQFNESKIFDNHNDLVEHVERFLDKIYIERPSAWKQKLREILTERTSNASIASALLVFAEEVKKDLGILENFLVDTDEHIAEFDEIFQKMDKLDFNDEEAYESLEKIKDRIEQYKEFIEQYIEDLESLHKNYIEIDEKIAFLMKLDFKSFF